jgi:hypothetical protein
MLKQWLNDRLVILSEQVCDGEKVQVLVGPDRCGALIDAPSPADCGSPETLHEEGSSQIVQPT